MKNSTANISALAAVGGTLIALPAAALELGEVQVQSHLGQPLRASVAYALAPTEALSSTCVSIQSSPTRGGIPGVGDATVSVANGVISITGKTAMREPLVTMRLNVRCPYAAQIARDYTMLVDPAGIVEAVQAQTTQPTTVTAPTATRTAATTANTRRSVSAEPVVRGTRYQVQPGESLSEIAERITNRPVGLWPAVFAILDANPGAFVDGDPNKLKAGSWLTIPDFGTGEAVSVAAATPVVEQAATTETLNSSIYTGTTADQAAAPSDPLVTTPDELALNSLAAEETATLDATETTSAPVVSIPDAQVVDIPDTQLDAPAATSSSPNVATARVQRSAAPESGTNWLLWLGGAGLALIALLLFFGRLVRNRLSSSPIAEAVPQDRRQPDSSRTLEIVSEIEVSIDELDETQENLALDADLIIGSGLQENNEIDVAQDFGFAATTHLDHEFTDEMVDGSSTAETDIIPPLNIEAQSILESEVLPDDDQYGSDGDDYDMSVVLDATKMPDPEDVTLRDLEAIPVDTGDDTLVTGDYTVSAEVDYAVIEQDYEDELSATQALNEEIARAAAELTEEMETQKSETSLASIAALEVTSEFPANNDEFFDVGDSDDDIDDDDVTANMPAKRGA